MTPPWLRNGYMALIALFLLAPLVVVAGISVNAKKTLLFPPEGFSLSWYGDIFAEPGWRAALVASVGVAALSAAIAVAIAMPLAWFLWRRVAPWAPATARSSAASSCRSSRPTWSRATPSPSCSR